MVLAAIGAVGLTITIPLVTKALIDGPITDRDLSGVLPLGLLALALGVLEAVLILVRRWVQSNAVLGLETTIRHDLYERLQQLPMSFHSSGSPASCSRGPPPTCPRSGGSAASACCSWCINILQVRSITGVLLHMYWPLGLVVAATAVPIMWLSMRFEKSYVVVSRRVQDEQGDLATRSEEGAVGIRVIKSFGRSRARLGAVRDGRAQAVRRPAWTRSGCRRGSGPSSR